ncbi:MAG TPA: 3-methyl-2-oxobutanoate hydroxymethyltransferase [Acidimicrobiales bacterium]
MTTSVPSLRKRKRRLGAAPLVMVTAYDEPTARYADAAGVDVLLVGDSLANVVLGHEDTLHVTTADMAHHVRAVAAAKPSAHVVADLPWLSYHVGIDAAVANAGELIRAGAQSVKLEGGAVRRDVVRALLDAEIPVMGHLGLTPQSVLAMGGYRVQAKTRDAAKLLLEDALILQSEGIYCLVVEGVPRLVGTQLTEALDIPTVGIGAGPDTDGQVLVLHDLLGLTKRQPPKFVRRYAEVGDVITNAVAAYARDVRNGTFPSDAESYDTPEELLD